MQDQKVKVTTDDGSGYVGFFFDHSFKTALQHATHFMDHNKHKPMTLYIKNTTPYGPRWIRCLTHCSQAA